MNSPLTSNLQEFRLDDSVEAAHWDELVARSPDADVYHCAAYVLASAELEGSQPLGVLISSGKERYLVPLLLRPISGPDGQSWCDASTPYGYGGVIYLGLDSGVAPPDGTDLFERLSTWAATRKLVSCVLRSHPLLAQNWLFAQAPGIDFIAVTRHRQTVAVPLYLWDNTRRCPPGLSKGRRSDLALARRKLRVTWNVPSDQRDALEQLRIFRVLYDSTMRRVNADKFFTFPWPYYERLSTLVPNVGIAIAWLADCAVGGAVFMAGPTYAHYHLSASDDTGRQYKASTLLVVEGAIWARQRGCRVLHLGGGMRLNDSLIAFKRRFGGENREVGNITLIADRRRYNSMRSLAAPPWPYNQQKASDITTSALHL